MSPCAFHKVPGSLLLLFLRVIVLSRLLLLEPLTYFNRTRRQTPSTMADGAIKNGVFVEYNTHAPKEERVLPLFSLRGKTAIVSGAGAGIGLAVAQGFAEAGANVAIWYHSNKKALDRAAEIEKDYGVKCKKRLARV